MQWQETASMIFTQTPGDSAALTSLGDYLAASRWFEAAHVWCVIRSYTCILLENSFQLSSISPNVVFRRDKCAFRTNGFGRF